MVVQHAPMKEEMIYFFAGNAIKLTRSVLYVIITFTGRQLTALFSGNLFLSGANEISLETAPLRRIFRR